MCSLNELDICITHTRTHTQREREAERRALRGETEGKRKEGKKEKKKEKEVNFGDYIAFSAILLSLKKKKKAKSQL